MAVVHVTGLPQACEVLRLHTKWTHDRCARECGVSLSTWQKMLGEKNPVSDPLKIQRHFVDQLILVYAAQIGTRPTLTID